MCFFVQTQHGKARLLMWKLIFAREHPLISHKHFCSFKKNDFWSNLEKEGGFSAPKTQKPPVKRFQKWFKMQDCAS